MPIPNGCFGLHDRRDISGIGRLMVVGGHSRGVGKTSLIAALLPRLPSGKWVAVKISSHRHGSGPAGFSVSEERDAADDTPQARWLAAGASRTFLLRARDETMCEAAAWVRTMLDRGYDLIVESNRIVRFLRPDMVLFVVAPTIADWKASSADCLRLTDLLVVNGAGAVPGNIDELCPGIARRRVNLRELSQLEVITEAGNSRIPQARLKRVS
jgi:hypothetical protein